MSAGSYLSSKAEKEIFDSELEKETKFVEEVPYLAQESLLSALEKEGTSRETSYRIVKLLHNEKSVFVKTFQEKVLGLGTADISNPIKGALVMAFSFILGALIPMLPYFFIHGDFALILSVGLSTFTLFGVGAFKGYLANKNIFLSGLEFFAIALGASAFGYLIGILIEFLYKVKLPTV
jgi:predicted membrane protein (TIGR00267 family)